MKLPVSWLRALVDVPEDPALIARTLGACGFAVESVEPGVIDFEITANRPDCLSVRGLAREAAVAFGRPLRWAPPSAPPPGSRAPLTLSLNDSGCGRYALAVADVRVGASPSWLTDRLLAAGVRPINNVVDVTNYVMLELGQPMHAFDLSRLAGPEIHVRRARTGERLTTLDGETRVLDETMLVIADRDRPVAVAGVMGGATSEVSTATTRIALESAWFVAGTVRATSKKLNLKTEASARFERGADPEAPVIALHRALELLTEIGAGQLVGGITDLVTHPAAPRSVDVTRTHVARLLGAVVADAEIERILRGLAFGLTPMADGWHVHVPSWRVDVTREADVIEEVGRHWGFDRIPPRFPALATQPRASAPAIGRARRLRRLLCGAGLQEAVTFTFMEEVIAAPFAPAADRVVITNPLSEKFAVLRPSIVPGLVESLSYNLNRQATDVRLFEVGTIFSKLQGERSALGWVITGSRGDHWSGQREAVGFTDAKGIAELVAPMLGRAVDATAADDLPWLTPGQSARLRDSSGADIGWVGRLRAPRGIDEPVFAGEIWLSANAADASAGPSTVHPLPRFPSVVRDLSIIVDERLPAARVRDTIRSHGPSTLASIREFDRYQGKGVPDGHVSLSVRLTFRHADRTLTDTEVQQAVDRIVTSLQHELDAVLRGR